MSDNRITVRFNPDQIQAMERHRAAFFMDRQEFVRYCVSEHLRKLSRDDSEYHKELSRVYSENSELKRWIEDNL